MDEKRDVENRPKVIIKLWAKSKPLIVKEYKGINDCEHYIKIDDAIEIFKATNDSKPTLEEIEEIIEQYTFGDDEWGGSKLAEWKYGTCVVVGGITEAAEEILKRLA